MSKHLLHGAVMVVFAALSCMFALPAGADVQAPNQAVNHKLQNYTGTIESIDAAVSTFTVKGFNGKTMAFTCDAACDIRTVNSGRVKFHAALSDLKIGDRANVSYTEKDGKAVCHFVGALPPPPVRLS